VGRLSEPAEFSETTETCSRAAIGARERCVRRGCALRHSTFNAFSFAGLQARLYALAHAGAVQSARRNIQLMTTSLSPPLPPRAGPTRITGVAFDVTREPLRKPLGFKGAQFTEKWVSRVTLTAASGARATAFGGLAPLWADERVFLGHTETGANVMLAAITEAALQQVRTQPFASPVELHDRIFSEVHGHACRVTGLADLRPTFTLNALVALDHAAWLLQAQERRITTFDDLIAAEFGALLPEQHRSVACIPLISYTTAPAEMVQLVDDGHFVLKVKIGSAGDDRQMLEADKQRLLDVFRLVGHRETAHTPDGRIRFYLDANGRYRRAEEVRALLEFADRHRILPQIALFEEPFDERVDQDVHDWPVLFAADESVHEVADVVRRWQAGYRAFALKPAGKGLSMTLRTAREALRLGAACFVADSACTPVLLDWNKHVAARLPALPGLKLGVMELNGPQQYAHWDRLIAAHPEASRPWMQPVRGAFEFDAEFFAGGGLFSHA
jgi:hypothetical protein